MKITRTKVLAAALGIIVVAVFPSWVPIPSRATANEQATQARGEADALRNQISRARAAQQDATGFAATKAALEQAVPNGPDLPALISQIRSATEAVNMLWLSGSPQQSALANGSGKAWTLSMSLQGRASSAPDLLDRLRSIERLVVIDSVSFQGAGAGEVILNITLHFWALEATDPRIESTAVTESTESTTPAAQSTTPVAPPTATPNGIVAPSTPATAPSVPIPAKPGV